MSVLVHSRGGTGTTVADANPDIHAVAFQWQLAQDNATVLSSSNLTDYAELLCTEGHSGRVCAVCRPGYGRTAEGMCVKVWRGGAGIDLRRIPSPRI